MTVSPGESASIGRPARDRDNASRKNGWKMRMFWVVWMAYVFFRDGFDRNAFTRAAFLIALAGASWLVEKKSTRPRRTYYRFILFSALIAFLFIAETVMDHGDVMLSVIGWVGVTILALIWAVYYERTERLS